MKNIKTALKNSMEGLIRLDKVEEKISKLKDRGGKFILGAETKTNEKENTSLKAAKSTSQCPKICTSLSLMQSPCSFHSSY